MKLMRTYHKKKKLPLRCPVPKIFCILALIVVPIGLIVLSWFLITSYPRWILSNTEYIALSTNPHVFFLLLLIYVPGLIILTRSTKTKIVFLMTIVSLLYLAADNYYYIDNQNLHFNPFLGVNEKTISLNELREIEVGIKPNIGRNSWGISWEYILVFTTGDKFEMNEAKASELLNLHDFFLQKQIPFKYTTVHQSALNYLRAGGDTGDYREILNRVFLDNKLNNP